MPSSPKYYAAFLVNLGNQLGLDPRLLLSTMMLETRVCLGVMGLNQCRQVHRLQVQIQGGKASIGLANMDKPTFDATRDRHPEAFATFGGGLAEWEDTIESAKWSMTAMAYRMKDLEKMMPSQRGAGHRYTKEELLDFGYRGTEKAFTDVTRGDDFMADHGTKHLAIFREKWAEADKIICHSGYWTCGG